MQKFADVFQNLWCWMCSCAKSVKNLWVWFRIIRKNEDGDFKFLLEIMRFKLERMIAHKKNNGTPGWEKDVWHMNICSRLLDRINNDHYIIAAIEDFEKKWGSDVSISFVPAENNTSKFVIEGPNVVALEDMAACNQEFHEAINKAAQKQLKAKRLLFEIMNRKVDSWSV